MHVLITGELNAGTQISPATDSRSKNCEQETACQLSLISQPYELPKFEGAYAEHAMDIGDPAR